MTPTYYREFKRYRKFGFFRAIKLAIRAVHYGY